MYVDGEINVIEPRYMSSRISSQFNSKSIGLDHPDLKYLYHTYEKHVQVSTSMASLAEQNSNEGCIG